MKRHYQSLNWPICPICEEEKMHPNTVFFCQNCTDKVNKAKNIALWCLGLRRTKNFKEAKKLEQEFNKILDSVKNQ